MKLLLDQNISYKILAQLDTLFPGSKHINEFGLERSTDTDIYKFAIENDYILVSQDADFYEMSLFSDLNPKIIWLRCGNTRSDEICKILEAEYIRIFQFYESSEKCLQLY